MNEEDREALEDLIDIGDRYPALIAYVLKLEAKIEQLISSTVGTSRTTEE